MFRICLPYCIPYIYLYLYHMYVYIYHMYLYTHSVYCRACQSMVTRNELNVQWMVCLTGAQDWVKSAVLLIAHLHTPATPQQRVRETIYDDYMHVPHSTPPTVCHLYSSYPYTHYRKAAMYNSSLWRAHCSWHTAPLCSHYHQDMPTGHIRDRTQWYALV